MNEVRIAFIPATPPSGLGYNASGPSFRPELDGAMLSIGFSTPDHGCIKICCTHEWALNLAVQIERYARECQAHCKKHSVIPVQATP